MKRIFIITITIVISLAFLSCNKLSYASLELFNVGDVDVGIWIRTDNKQIYEYLEVGKLGIYDFSWPGFGGLEVFIEVEDLNDGEIITDILYLYDGDTEEWDVGFIYSAAGKSAQKVLRLKGKTNLKKAGK